MATRFYLPASGSPPVTPPAVDSAWTVSAGAETYPLKSTKSNTAKALGTLRTKGTSSANINQIDRQYLSEFQLAAQTITGTFSSVIRGWESATALDARAQIIIRVVSADGSTVRGTLYAGSTAAVSATVGDESQELSGTAATSRATRIKNGLTLSSVAAQDGDRLLVEIGARLGSSSTTTTFQFEYGDPSATADYALTAALTTDLVPWIEFSQDFAAYSPPTGGGGSTTNPVIRSFSVGAEASGQNTVNITKPSGLIAGDYLLALQVGDADNTLSSPLGALSAQAGNGTTNIPPAKLSGRIATSSDAAAASFTFTSTYATGTDSIILVAIQAGTFDPDNPITLGTWTGTARTSTRTQTALGLTGVKNGLLLGLFGTEASGVAQAYSTPPTGMTLVASQNSPNSYALAGMFSQVLAADGATGTRVATPTGSSTTNGWSAALAMVNPAPVAAVTTTYFFLS